MRLAGVIAFARRRLLLLLLAVGVIFVVGSSELLHDWIVGLLTVAEPILRQRPVLGVVVFVGLAATSAMVAFVSSAVIVPVAILVWGKALSAVLLWTGWIVGGTLSYLAGRYLGRPVVNALKRNAELEKYERLITNRAPYHFVLLFQFALPSEVPGYLLGLARYSYLKYLSVLIIAELPYSIGTIFIGSSFLDRQNSQLILLASGAVVVSSLSVWMLQRWISNRPRKSSMGE